MCSRKVKHGIFTIRNGLRDAVHTISRRELTSLHKRWPSRVLVEPWPLVSHSSVLATPVIRRVANEKYPRTKEKRALTLRKACDLWMSSIYIAVLNMILLLCSQCERCASSCHTIAGFWLIARISLDQNAGKSGILTWRSACKLSELGDKVFRINCD